MKNQNISPELKELIRGKSAACVSMILPMDEVPSNFRINEIVSKNAHQKLNEQLHLGTEPETAELIKDKLNSLKNQLTSSTGVKGLGVYLSEKITTIMTFPFEVKEKIVVGNSFEIRDMVQNEDYLLPYFVLSVTKDAINLYKGVSGRLNEINDRNFPIETLGAEYQLPVVDNIPTESAAAAKQDIVTTQNRTEAFNIVNTRLADYLSETTPLVLTGSDKEISYIEPFLKGKHIIGKVKGNYADYNLNELEEKTWESMLLEFKNKERDLIENLAETPVHLLSSGLQNAWPDAKMGKGKIVLVERDLEIPVWQGKDEFSIQLEGKGQANSIPDAVDDLIETVLEKDGRVVLVDNGMLKQYEGIVLIKRFA